LVCLSFGITGISGMLLLLQMRQSAKERVGISERESRNIGARELELGARELEHRSEGVGTSKREGVKTSERVLR
jgi:hypothetical protein